MHNIKIGTGVLNKCLQKLKLIKTTFYNLLGRSERKREQFFHFFHNRIKNRCSNHYGKSPKVLVVDSFSQKQQATVFNFTMEDSIKTFRKIQISFLRYTYYSHSWANHNPKCFSIANKLPRINKRLHSAQKEINSQH